MEITNEIMELFRPAYGAERETIAAEGFQWEINWSSIQSKLIYLAGRYCDRFASEVRTGRIQGPYGFREDGVDNSSFVINRYIRQYEYSNGYGAQYRALWRLDIDVDNGIIGMKLYPVERSISQERVRQAVAAAESRDGI